MISFEIFLLGLMIVSTFTSLVTEAVKKILVAHNVKYHADCLAGIVAAILSAVIGVGYVILTNSTFNTQVVVCILAMIFMGWLCAMVGYDKVMKHLKINKKDDE